MNKTIKPTCPRCGNKDLRAERRRSFVSCRNCGYRGHWKQFYEGEAERKIVQELFAQGNLEGDPLLGSAEKPLLGGKEAK